MKSAVVPTFLPTLSEVCSLAVLAGGGGSVLRQSPWQWLSQSQRECLSNQMLEANFRRSMKLGMAPWMWSFSGLDNHVSEWIRKIPLQDERSVMSFFSPASSRSN